MKFNIIPSFVKSKNKVDVNLQDQVTRPIIVKFNQVSNSTTLAALAVKGAYTINVTSTTGFTDGKYIILFDPASENFSFYIQVGAVAGQIVTLDTPVDFAYPAGTFVDTAITNMAVDGSSSVQTFGLRGTGSPPGVDISVDITRIIITCLATSPVSLALFANITALTRGLVLRKRDGEVQNIFNVKSNGEIAGIMYDWTPYLATNPQQGIDGFVARLTFAGANKVGVAIRLPIGRDLEILVQDALQTITLLEIVAEGHIVE